MVYGSEVILPTDLDYGVPRVRVYDELGAEASLEDAMDQLDEAHDIALHRSAKYQQASVSPVQRPIDEHTLAT